MKLDAITRCHYWLKHIAPVGDVIECIGLISPKETHLPVSRWHEPEPCPGPHNEIGRRSNSRSGVSVVEILCLFPSLIDSVMIHGSAPRPCRIAVREPHRLSCRDRGRGGGSNGLDEPSMEAYDFYRARRTIWGTAAEVVRGIGEIGAPWQNSPGRNTTR